MHKIISFSAYLFIVSAGISACRMDDDIKKVPSNGVDINFMKQASYANRSEIDFAQLALTKSDNDSVKAFAQMIIADHTAALSSLDSLGDQFNLSLPGTLDSTHAALKPQLMSLSGHNFDTTYVNGQIKDHLTAISLFRNEIADGYEPAMKNYATANLPHLQMHLQTADTLKAHL